MNTTSARLSFAFSSLGHFYIHMFQAYFGVVVLTLESEWSASYEDLIKLWTVGAVLIGAGAIPAGRLADKLSARTMMAVYFFGIGGAAIACGLTDGPTGIMIALAALGLFMSIYHPVGIPWLIRNATSSTGKLLAINGLFGSFGTAGAGLIAGSLIAAFGWREAYLVPGLVCLATGAAMVFCCLRGWIAPAPPPESRQEESRGRGELLRVFLILVVAMVTSGILYNTMQTGLPKLFQERMGGDFVVGPKEAGEYFALVFMLGGVMQFVGGTLADRYPLKLIYVACWFVQTLVLAFLANAVGLSLIAFAALSVMFNLMSLPAENMMLFRFTPARHRGLAFGVKFVLSFMAGPAAILLISAVREATGGFSWLFGGIAVATGLVALLLLALPQAHPTASAEAPAE